MSFVLSLLVLVFANLFPVTSWAAEELFDDVQITGQIAERVEYKENEVTSILFDNGVRLNYRQIYEMEGDVRLSVTLAGGVIEETPDTQRLTLAACNAYAFATSKHVANEIYSFAKDRSIDLELENNLDHVLIEASCRNPDLESLFKIIRACLTDCLITREQFEAWKQGQMKKLDQPEQDLVNVIRNANLDLLLAPSEVRLKPLVQIAELENVDYKAANLWLQRIFTQAPLQISLIGDINVKHVINLAQRYFGSMPQREVLSQKTLQDKRFLAFNAGPYYSKFTYPYKAKVAAVYVGYLTSLPKSKEMELLLQVFERRLFKKARINKQPTFRIESFIENNEVFRNLGFFGAYIRCRPDKADTFAGYVVEVMQEIAKEGPTEIELKKARKQQIELIDDDQAFFEYWLYQMTKSFYRNEMPSILKTGKIPDYQEIRANDLKMLMQEIIRPENHTRIIVEGQKGY